MLEVDEAPSISANNQKGTGTRRKSRTIDVAAIEALDRDDCIERWRQMFGVAPPKYTSLEFMRKALAYEVQVKAFGGHSNAVQRALKASLKAVRSEIEADNSADTNVNTQAHDATASTSRAESNNVIEGSAADSYHTIQHNSRVAEASDQITNTCEDRTTPSGTAKTNGKAGTRTTASPKPNRSITIPKPSVLSIRAGTHLVREWNGRTYQVEALEKGFQLDGKTYRSLSAIAKKITGAHWSGPRFFGLES